jgi:hypothetical protein
VDLLESERHGRITFPDVLVVSRSSSPDVAQALGPAHGTLPLKSVVAVIVGNWLEFYDFLVFTFLAVMISGNLRAQPLSHSPGREIPGTDYWFPTI